MAVKNVDVLTQHQSETDGQTDGRNCYEYRTLRMRTDAR